MFILYIKGNDDLLTQVNNVLSVRNADYDLAYSEEQLSDMEGYIVTNVKLKTFPDKSRILYYGYADGYTCFQDPHQLIEYMSPEESIDIGHLRDIPQYDLEDLDPLKGVIQLMEEQDLNVSEEDWDIPDLISSIQEEERPHMRVLLAKNLPAPEPESEPILEPEPVHMEAEIVQVSPPPAYTPPEPEEELETPPPIMRPQVYEQPAYQPRPSYQPAYPQSPVDPSTLPATNVHGRMIRRREDIYAARSMCTQPPLGRSGRLRSTRDRGRTNHIYVITGASPRCGVSSFAYSLASSLAKGNIGQVLLIDLDVLKPDLSKKLGALYDLMDDGDDTINNFATMNLDDMMNEIEYLTTKITTSEGTNFSFIRGCNLSFKERKLLCSLDYTSTLQMLGEVYSDIVIDLGHYNGMQPYQENLINNIYNIIMIIDCTSIDTAREGAAVACQVGETYSGVLSKYNDRVNVFKMQSTLQRAILGKMPSRTSAADIWRTGEPFGVIKEPKFAEDWGILMDGMRRL